MTSLAPDADMVITVIDPTDLRAFEEQYLLVSETMRIRAAASTGDSMALGRLLRAKP